MLHFHGRLTLRGLWACMFRISVARDKLAFPPWRAHAVPQRRDLRSLYRGYGAPVEREQEAAEASARAAAPPGASNGPRNRIGVLLPINRLVSYNQCAVCATAGWEAVRTPKLAPIEGTPGHD